MKIRDWLDDAQDFAQRTGMEPRSLYVLLLAEVEQAHPGAVAAALARLAGLGTAPPASRR
jgi:hypothetical protein